MNLEVFRQIVKSAAPGIVACEDDLPQLYDYVGLEHGPGYTRSAVTEALNARMRDCFTSGHAAVRRACELMRTDLIREHVLNGTPLDPYFEVLNRLLDALRPAGTSRALIDGDWNRAIRSAVDHVQINRRGEPDRERAHTRDFMVAKAARALRDAGFAIRLEPGRLSLEKSAETALITTIEELVATMGGINVARRIFDAITPLYDTVQQRYHVVQQASTIGGGQPQMPWGFLIQLAAKHAQGRKPYINTGAQWGRLCSLSQAFAALTDVQHYASTFYGTMDAIALLPYLQEMAVYDTLFRIPQMRSTDVVKIARGMFAWLDMSAPTRLGWSIDQVLEIIGYLLDPARDARGPIFVGQADIQRACPEIPREIVTQILDEVLSHPPTGVNRNFLLPMDAPIPTDNYFNLASHDFFNRPLLHHSGRRFILLDRSACAPACLEALLTYLRKEVKDLDNKVGLAIEHFLKSEFASRGIPIAEGNYNASGEHGECDLVVEAPGTVIFIEVKKKPLTRRARAGSDAHLLLDLAGSLLAAQAQAGWHEVRLRRNGHLDLQRGGTTTRLDLNNRSVERVAVSLFDFGSLQDRILLKQFLEATLNASFTPNAANLNTRFDEINAMLGEIRQQVTALHPDEKAVTQPFFNCWFISVPQLLVLLDGVTDVADFKSALWSCRHIVTGSSDLYFDSAYMRQSKMLKAAQEVKTAG